MQLIKTRFAPSPTGNPHIGNIRTALFAYLFSKRQQGEFLLRIEDTDKTREVEGSVEGIIESLEWLGLKIDGKPVLQSSNFETHKKYIQELVDKDLAYKEDGAVYFRVPKDGETSWVDLIGGKKISFDNKVEKDFVIVRANGIPVYHLAATVDDYLMGITHVIRGDDWVSSTPKHIMIYQAFGWEVPQFAHLPQVLASDRSKLSKRHGAIGVFDFKKDGYLPEALRNYIALLGWTPPSGEEFLSIDEMIKVFDLKDVHIAPAVFDFTKLEWMNGEYIRKTQNSNLKDQIYQYTRDLSGGALKPVDHPTEEEIEKLVPLIKERIKKLSDFVPLTDFIFEEPEYDKEVFNKLKVEDVKEKIMKITEAMEKMEKPWKSEVFEKTFRDLAEELQIKAGEMFQILRVLISGQLVTPPLFECLKIIGEEETLKRVKKYGSIYN
jgi:glutamyl-tRNA synthetase